MDIPTEEEYLLCHIQRIGVEMTRYLRALAARLRGLLGKRGAEIELDDEIETHLRLLTERYVRQGMSEDEAVRAARRQFGNVTLLREANREMRGIRLIDTFFQDLRYGLWMLRRNLGFTCVAVLTLALGIGANTAIFSVVNAVLLRSLPYRDPERLVFVGYKHARENGVSPAADTDFLEWRDQAKSFEQIAAYRNGIVDLTGSGERERLYAGMISADMFATLGVAPALGRAFTQAEDRAGATPVVILSDGLWRLRFGGDPHVIGRTLTLQSPDGRLGAFPGRTVVGTVVGIMPQGFQLLGSKPDLWVPLALDVAQALSRQNTDYVDVIARLKPGLTREAARADLSVIVERKRQALPDGHPDFQLQVRVFGLREWLLTDAPQTALLILFGAVAFVLLIACANVANLLLARSAARQREMAIRAAVGAGRLRLVRQLLTECLLLSAIGGAAGLLVANWSIRLLVAVSPAGIPRIEESSVDGQVLGFTCMVVVLVGLIAGIFPALQASKVDLNETLKAQSAATGHTGPGGIGRMLPALMIAELALALVLLTGAGLMIKSFLRLLAVPKGFNHDGVLTLSLTPENVKIKSAYYQEALARVQALPGIESAALATTLPILRGRSIRYFDELIEGRPASEQPRFDFMCISPEFFQTMGMQMRDGRPFTSQDSAGGQQVVIINETFARRILPNQNPIGHRLLARAPATIVGVVGDTRKILDQEAPLQVYVPLTQRTNFYDDDGGSLWLVVRAASGQNNPTGLSSLAGAIRNHLRAIEPNAPVNKVVTMDEHLSNWLAMRRFQMLLLGVFAAMALIIATVGIYGVISYGVSQRTHEIGIRMALGAQASDVLRMVIWRGMSLTLIGVALGLAAALALTRVLKNLLFEVKPTDPATFALIALLLVGVALIASYIPARRATKVDPLQALRHE
jgi:predicted permease